MLPDDDEVDRRESDGEATAAEPPAPSFRAKMTILAIGGIALLGIGAMCAVVFVLIALDR